MKIYYISKIKTLINNQGKLNQIILSSIILTYQIWNFFFLGKKKCISVEQGIVKSSLQQKYRLVPPFVKVN